jgi:rare lipoprotein A
MRKLVMGCAVGALVLLSARTEARPPVPVNVLIAASLGQADQLGVASWYGPELQGSLTAAGKPFDMNGLTAAHRELPLGTSVRVTNLRNDRSVTVTINDRGPSIPGRLIDVSLAAAKDLGFVRAGLAPVRIDVVHRPGEKNPSATANPSSSSRVGF